MSGPDAVAIADHSFSNDLTEMKSAGRVDGELDTGTASIPGTMLVWPTDRSFTRQPSVEFHSFGSSPVLNLALQTFCDAGARPAQPGEFTMRAFLSGRIDLTQAEAVLAVIDAGSRDQLDLALGQLAGGLGAKLKKIRLELMDVLAELEAGLDFVDEDIEFISSEELTEKLGIARLSLQQLLSQIESRDRPDEKFRVALFGMPNAGKSSLLNALAGEDVAIVTATQGTTTDRVTKTIAIGAAEIELVDTAGFEEATAAGSISAASQSHRTDELRRCDLAVMCIAAPQLIAEGITAWHAEQLAESGTEWIILATQCDRLAADAMKKIQQLDSGWPILVTSSRTGDGVESLGDRLAVAAIEHQHAESGVVGSTIVRTGDCLRESLAAVESAQAAARDSIGEEIVASEIRAAMDHLGQFVGAVYTDDILDVVFSRFCIGK